MQITFESTVFDPVGVISLESLPGSNLSVSTRRVTRTATLDGQDRHHRKRLHVIRFHPGHRSPP